MKTVLSRLHPASAFVYLAGILIMAALNRHPWMTCTQLLCLGGIYLYYERHPGKILPFIGIILLSAVLNGVFVQRGNTAAVTAAGRTVTAEALLYGGNAGILLVNVLFLFSLWNRCFRQEHWVYLFGSAFPKLGVILSMAMNLIPKYRKQAEKFSNVRKELYKESAVRRAAAVCSMELTWAFESSMDQLDSMNARGYGTVKRSHFHLFQFGKRDGCFMAAAVLLFLINLYGFWKFYAHFYFYPEVRWGGFDLKDFCFVLCMGIQILLPLLFWEGGKKLCIR